MTDSNGNPLTHFDDAGNAIMVDVAGKATTHRVAVAAGSIRVSPEIMRAILSGGVAKGDVMGVARLAGIMATKKTASLIPLCHPLGLDSCRIDFRTDEAANTIEVQCRVEVVARTGVEMEALTGVSVALLTIYDMTKALGKDMEIGGIRLLEKMGGKSGHYVAEGGAV